MKRIRIIFNFICYLAILLIRSVGTILLIALFPVYIIPILLIAEFNRDVTCDYKSGNKWWFKFMNKKEKAQP